MKAKEEREGDRGGGRQSMSHLFESLVPNIKKIH